MNTPLTILGGAMGTELQRRGVPTTLPLWSANAFYTNPAKILEIHQDYAKDADVITTNTFRTTARTLAKDPHNPRYIHKYSFENEAERITKIAIKLGQIAIEATNPKVKLAVSVTTLEDCYRPDLTPDYETCFKEYERIFENIHPNDNTLILLETFNSLKELNACLDAINSSFFTNSLTVWVSVIPKSPTLLNSTNNIKSLIDIKSFVELTKLYPQVNALLINCIPPDEVEIPLKELAKHSHLPFGIYAQGDGHPGNTEGWEFNHHHISPQEYLNYAKKWRKMGASIIGGCCGTTPEHIKVLREQLK